MSKALDSGAVSAFCEGVAMMHSAGIQLDEAVDLLSDGMKEGPFRDACQSTYRSLIGGRSMAQAMADSEAFPDYALDMVAAGEHAGRLENVLSSLATYYSEEERLFSKMRSAIMYPAALLSVMTAILLFTVVAILPVFMDVYENVAGSIAASSFGYVNLSLVIGWAALVVMAIGTGVAFFGVNLSRSSEGRTMLIARFESFGPTRDAMYSLALSRFSAALATYLSTGMDSASALQRTLDMTTHPELKKRGEQALADMLDANKNLRLSQAIHDHQIFDALYARMMMVGGRSGTSDKVLARLSNTFFDDGIMQIDAVIDAIEPALAAFLTIAVGTTLISVMLPLIGIMTSIG